MHCHASKKNQKSCVVNQHTFSVLFRHRKRSPSSQQETHGSAFTVFTHTQTHARTHTSEFTLQADSEYRELFQKEFCGHCKGRTALSLSQSLRASLAIAHINRSCAPEENNICLESIWIPLVDALKLIQAKTTVL